MTGKTWAGGEGESRPSTSLGNYEKTKKNRTGET